MPPLMQTRLGVMRLGYSRLAYPAAALPVPLRIALGGVDRTTRCRISGCSVTHTLGGTPSTATLRVSGIVPVRGQSIALTLAGVLIFAGHIQQMETLIETLQEQPLIAHVAFDLTCIDYTWLLDQKKVTKRYTSQSATVILTSLIATYATGFTTANVAAGLPTIDAITYTDADLSECIDQAMSRVGGSSMVDFTKDLHAYLASTLSADAITDGDPAGMITIRESVDLSQVRNRMLVKGAGSTASSDVSADSTLPIADGEAFSATGGKVTTPSQRLTYTSVVYVDRPGTLSVGLPGTPPGTIAGVALSKNYDGDMAVGTYNYRTTLVSVNGETAGSGTPAGASITSFGGGGTVVVSPVSATPGGLTPGAYGYSITFVNANGETIGGTVTSGTITRITAPAAGPTLTAQTITNAAMAAGTYKYAVSFTDAGGETTATQVNQITISAPNNAVALTAIPTSSDARVTGRKIYRSKVNASAPYYLIATLGDNTTTAYTDQAADLALTVPSLAANTSGTGQMALTSIATGPTGTTARNIYRTAVDVAAGVTTLKRVAVLSNNTTTTYTDSQPDSSLGESIPSVSTANGGQMSLTAIPTGPAGTTARKIYRTAVGGSAPYKLLTTISDNTTTAYTDNTPDASLGDELGAGSIMALVGGTVLAVASVTAFVASGWVRVGSQVLHYGGISGSSLTGIPASGAGSITSPIAVGSEVVGEPHLIGIASPTATVVQGEAVRVLVIRNDTASQTAMAAMIGGGCDGIFEESIDAGDVSETECIDIGDAHLAEVKDPIATLHYTTRNASVDVGRDQPVNLTTPPIVGTYKIQRVTLTDFGQPNRLWPLRTVEASSRRFSFEQLLKSLARARKAR